MEVVFEVVSRGGHTIERHRASGERIAIGRAYDNELILTDETVSPHHAVLDTGPDGRMCLVDTGSLNGIRSDRHGAAQRIEIESGETCTLGRARIRIYAAEHPVSATVRVGELDGLINRLGSYPAVVTLIAAVAAVTVGELWLTSYSGIEWGQFGIGVFSVFTAVAAVAIFLAIIGRFIKHEGRLQTQFALVMAYLLAQSAIVLGYEIVLYNTLSPWFSAVLGLGASYLLLAFTLWLCLHIATNLGSAQRWKFAFALTSVLLCVSVYPEIVSRSEFSESPRYVKEVKPPALLVARGVDTSTFITHAIKAFESPIDETR